jgi:hypothetical protein
LSSTLTDASKCDGSGACVPGASHDCAPYACDGAAACLASCTLPTDCATGSLCIAPACQ